MRILLFLLAFSLILQNTCPYGFAAKTAFAAPHSHQCSFHRHQTKEQRTVDDNSNKVMYPAFVMITPFIQPSIEGVPVSTYYLRFSFCGYTNPFKDPRIKPPIA